MKETMILDILEKRLCSVKEQIDKVNENKLIDIEEIINFAEWRLDVLHTLKRRIEEMLFIENIVELCRTGR